MKENIFSEYLTFSKKERIGIIVLLILIVFFATLPFFFSLFIKSPENDTARFEKEIASLQVKQGDTAESHSFRNFDENNYQNYYQPSEKYYTDKPRGELFCFDPNTLDADGWKRLGIRDKTAATIQNYISKGGRFYKPEDIGKIWGLHQDEVIRLLPYIRIAAAQNFTKKEVYENKTAEKTKYTPSIIDINTADTAMLIVLPGIGSKLSQRILAYRDKLGGFYKVEQIGETYGLPDSTFQKLKSRFTLSNTAVRKININTATQDEMRSHPYLRYTLANAIVNYRQQHGNFTAVNDLKKIMLITEEVYAKISPYITVK